MGASELNVPAEVIHTDGPYIRDDVKHFPKEIKFLAAVCLVLAAVLRCLRIGYRELFGDEFFTYAFASGDRPDAINSILHGNLPLYYEFIRGWGKMVGTQSELLMRLPSVAFGLLAFGAFFFFAQRYLRGMAFIICLLAFALNPILLATSIEATSFALLSLFVVLSNYFCIRSLDEGGRQNWTIYAVFTLLGALTHPLFWLVMLAQFGFATARPTKTPRAFVLTSAAGIFLLIILMIAGAVLAHQYIPKKLDVQTPSVGDLARGLVAVILGNFPRYGYAEKEFFRALLYLFVVVSLGLSVVYYRKRAAEASALPENVVWIDETQDVVGTWNRLSLASFLMFQWVTFLVPAFGLMLLGSFAPDVTLKPEYFIIGLPSLLILLAAGIDAAPGKMGTLALGMVMIAIMGLYDTRVLTDRGMGVKTAVGIIKERSFDPSKDALLYVTYPYISRGVDRYGKDLPGVAFPAKEPEDTTIKRLEQAIAGKERVFVIYHNDRRRVGNRERSLVKDWFFDRKDQYEGADDFELSRDENSYLKIYRRRAV